MSNDSGRSGRYQGLHEPKPVVNTIPRTKKAARGGPLLADALTSDYLALAGGTMPFIRRYSTI